MGDEYTVIATVTSLTGDGEPLRDVAVLIEISDGPNSPNSEDGRTDALGRFPFTYQGDGGIGRDTIIACIFDEDKKSCVNVGTGAEPRFVSAEATISWAEVLPKVLITLPDLTLRVLNQTLEEGDGRVTLAIVAAVDNIGNKLAPGTVVVAKVQETGDTGEADVRPLDIGDRAEVTIPLEISSPEPNRRYRVTVEVDPMNVIEEAKEDNNSYEVRFELDGGGIPWEWILIGAGLVAVPSGAFTIWRRLKEGPDEPNDKKDKKDKKDKEDEKKKSPYIANQHTREIHEAGCSLVEIMKDENKVPHSDLKAVANLIRNKGYNGCQYCLPRYDTNALSRQQVLANLEEDRPRR